MTPDARDLPLLYDAARGFVGLRRPREILRHALLSLLGACGVRFAVWLEDDGKGRFRARAARGLDELPAAALRLSARGTEEMVAGPRARRGRALEKLGGDWVRWARRVGAEWILPVARDGRPVAAVALGPRLLGDEWTERSLAVAVEIADLTAHAFPTAARRRAAAPGRKTARVEELRERSPALAEFRGDGPACARVFGELAAVADLDLPVLVLGETGTGKELVARAIHELSPRRDGEFEAVNCAAIPRDLMASALFGHERGAFTGAEARARGAFERAGEGTIFLDEIGDMPPDTQAALLRVLQERRFRRIGGEETVPAVARVVSATNRDLEREVSEGRFRADLFYRLQMYTVRIPPLRERRSDLPAIVARVLERLAEGGRAAPAASPGFVRALARRELPGNVRELESLVVGAVIRAGDAGRLEASHLEGERGAAPENAGDPGPDGVPTWENMERSYIRSVLQLTEGNRRRAAALMGIPRTTLNARIAKLGLAERAPAAGAEDRA